MKRDMEEMKSVHSEEIKVIIMIFFDHGYGAVIVCSEEILEKKTT